MGMGSTSIISYKVTDKVTGYVSKINQVFKQDKIPFRVGVTEADPEYRVATYLISVDHAGNKTIQRKAPAIDFGTIILPYLKNSESGRKVLEQIGPDAVGEAEMSDEVKERMQQESYEFWEETVQRQLVRCNPFRV